jgi:hypothetical protein
MEACLALQLGKALEQIVNEARNTPGARCPGQLNTAKTDGTAMVDLAASG